VGLGEILVLGWSGNTLMNPIFCNKKYGLIVCMLGLFDYFELSGPKKYAIFIWSKCLKIKIIKFGTHTCKTKSQKVTGIVQK
jgi:hypothetical protein